MRERKAAGLGGIVKRRPRAVLGRASWPRSLLAFAARSRLHKFFQIERHGLARRRSACTVTGFFDYVLVWNTGISYGLLGAVPVWVLGIVIAAALVALVLLVVSRRLRRWCALGLALCIGGALSNALDRLLYGAVADFFHFHWAELVVLHLQPRRRGDHLRGVAACPRSSIGVGRGKRSVNALLPESGLSRANGL